MRDSLPPEISLLLAFEQRIAFRTLAEQVDWGSVSRIASAHRVAGHLAEAIEKHEVTGVPPPVQRVVDAQRATHARDFRTSILPQFEAACRALLAAGTEPVVLKGCALVTSGIIEAGSRPMSDIDVLVPRERFGEAQRALEAIGYRPKASPSQRAWAARNHYQDVPLHHPDHSRTLDLHWHIQTPRHRRPFDITTFAIEPLELPDGQRATRLTDREMLTHLCLHFWRDRAAGRPHALGQLWDVALTQSRLRDADWVELARDAECRDHADVVAAVVALLHLLLGTPLPAGFPAAASLANDERLWSFAITRVLTVRPPHVQLLLVTDDVPFRAHRIATRVAAEFRRDVRRLQPIYGEPGAVRLRWRHSRYLIGLLAHGIRHPLMTKDELALDRWAHELH